MEIKARIRERRDKDIKDAVGRLRLEEGELSHLVRRGFRMALREIGELQTIDDLKLFERRSE